MQKRTNPNAKAPTFRRSLGGGRAFTGQWTCVHWAVDMRSLGGERRKVGGKRLGRLHPLPAPKGGLYLRVGA